MRDPGVAILSLRPDRHREDRGEVYSRFFSVGCSNRDVFLQSDQENRSTISNNVGKTPSSDDRCRQDNPKQRRERDWLACPEFSLSKASFVILIDDLEAGRSTSVKKIFDRYRLALDTILKPSQSRRASVHFLVNMLEAYYLADSRAVNSVLDTELEDYEGDVETVLNPKSRMKNLYPGFDEVNDGCRIIGSLSVSHVLSRQDACSCLRTMFAWIYKAIGQPECELHDLVVGRYDDVTKGQILELPP